MNRKKSGIGTLHAPSFSTGVSLPFRKQHWQYSEVRDLLERFLVALFFFFASWIFMEHASQLRHSLGILPQT